MDYGSIFTAFLLLLLLLRPLRCRLASLRGASARDEKFILDTSYAYLAFTRVDFNLAFIFLCQAK